jgi:hypothetical protein
MITRRKINKFGRTFAVNIKNTVLKTVRALTPGKEAVKGGGGGIIVATALLLIIPLSGMIKFIGIYGGLTIISILLVAAALFALLANLLLHLAVKIPLLTRLAVLAAVPIVMISFGTNKLVFFFILLFLVIFSFLAGAATRLLYLRRWGQISTRNRVPVIAALVVGFGGLALGTAWLIHPGKNIEPPVNASISGEYMPDALQLQDPSSKGGYDVMFITYGSGEDKRRKQYGKEADIITPSVNGSAFLSSWEGLSGKLRTWYFGFDRYSLPMNAKVWLPAEEGPFPLVLAVHGNHLAQDWSEGGYAYLGELLASRGYIFVSIDQNFLNGSFTNIFKGLSNENDVRGWLLLKHLEQWEQWNRDTLGLFFKKADMNNIALMGHSRGGEAAGHAALFSTLPHYPDDGRELFDFNFNIRSIISIAPSDRQYEPAGTGTPLKDINYFVMHGSHDADVQSFLGMRQFNRLGFSEDFHGFKSALYIYRANHGQFNTSWGKRDISPPRINLFNLRQLLPEDNQQQIAMVYISAFLEATLKKEKGYRQLFMDHRTGSIWLPETIFLSQYEQSGMQFISDFNEDLDLKTTSMLGGRIEAENLTVWREQTAKIKWGDQETRSAVIGWNNGNNDSLPARYTFLLPEEGIDGSDGRMLFLTLADADESPDPSSLEPETVNQQPDREPDSSRHEGNFKRGKVFTTAADNGEQEKKPVGPREGNEKNNDGNEKSCNPENKERLTGINFTIELSDDKDRTIIFPLEKCSLLQPRLKKQMTKLSFMKTAPESESIFSFFYFNIEQLAGEVDFNAGTVKKVSLLFDRTESGVIILNNIGFMP